MGRPRKHDTELPPCTYLRRGKYFFVRKGVWHNLGANKQVALERVAVLAAEIHLESNEVEAFVIKRLPNIRANAKARGLAFELTKADIVSLLRSSGATCDVTGVPFSLTKFGCMRPFAPSVDRKDCSKGYTPANCRIVCTAANMGMSDWGDEVLAKLASHMVKKRARVLDTVQQIEQ
jgi:hypothetical protein